MGKVICGVSISVDGFIAGNNMTFEEPFGDIPPELLAGWMFNEAEENKVEREALVSSTAYIMGANMFGPKDRRMNDEWKGWWGEEPPYHAPVFVLTHEKRAPIQMDGGTTFYFVNDGIESAMRQAQEVAGDGEVSIAGGANVINQYLAAGLIDELWLHIAPVTLGSGQRLFADVPKLQLRPLEVRTTKMVTHIKYEIVS